MAELLHEAVAISDGPTVVRFPKGTVGRRGRGGGQLGGMDVLREPEAEQPDGTAVRDVLLLGPARWR